MCAFVIDIYWFLENKDLKFGKNSLLVPKLLTH